MKNVAKRLNKVTIPFLAVALGLIVWDIIGLIPFAIITLIPIYGWIIGIFLGTRIILSYAFAIVFGIIALVKAAKNKSSTAIGILLCVANVLIGGAAGVFLMASGIISIVSTAMNKEEAEE